MTRLIELRATQKYKESSLFRALRRPWTERGRSGGRGGRRAGGVHVNGGERGKVLLECIEN